MKKDQHVIACVDRESDAAQTLQFAIQCAERLNHKGVILLNVASHQHNAPWVNDYDTPHICLRGDWHTAISGLTSTFGGILAISTVDTSAPRKCLSNPHTLLRSFESCKSAYICLPKGASTTLPHHVVITMDFHRESKEKIIWCSYFARFFGSSITVASHNYNDPGLRSKWMQNMRFLDKMFSSLGITYTPATLSGASWHNADIQAVKQLKPDLLIARATDRRDRDIIDSLAGPPEYRLLTNSSLTPILLLNQRDDLYVLCD